MPQERGRVNAGDVLFFPVYRAAAIFGTAVAGQDERLSAKTVVDGELFVGANAAFAEEENSAAGDAHFQIGIAAVVDAFGARAAHGAVNAPVAIEAEHGQFAREGI